MIQYKNLKNIFKRDNGTWEMMRSGLSLVVIMFLVTLQFLICMVIVIAMRILFHRRTY